MMYEMYYRRWREYYEEVYGFQHVQSVLCALYLLVLDAHDSVEETFHWSIDFSESRDAVGAHLKMGKPKPFYWNQGKL